MDLKDIPIEVAGGASVAIPAFWLFIKKILVRSANDTTEIKSAEAKTDVIELLRSEVERLGVINGKLAASLNELQLENVNLRQEISNLHNTINEMSERLNAMSRRASDRAPILDSSKTQGGI